MNFSDLSEGGGKDEVQISQLSIKLLYSYLVKKIISRPCIDYKTRGPRSFSEWAITNLFQI